MEVLQSSVLRSLGDVPYKVRYRDKQRPPPLPISRVRRFDRKCRDYKRAYMKFQTPRALKRASLEDNNVTFKFIENIIKRSKTHRCTGALQSRVCIDGDHD